MGLSMENTQEQLSIMAWSCCKAARTPGGCFPCKAPPQTECKSVGNCPMGAAAAALRGTMFRRTALLPSHCLCCQAKPFSLDPSLSRSQDLLLSLFWPCFPRPPLLHILPQMTSNAKRKQCDSTDGWGAGAPSLGEISSLTLCLHPCVKP